MPEMSGKGTNFPDDAACAVAFALVFPKPANISFRRWRLDAFLASIPWSGRILDVGGRQGIYRGTFRPPFDNVESREYVNINPAVNPDYLASADNLPVESGSKDIVLLSEVLEHLRPEKALTEAWRVLTGGPEGDEFLSLPPFSIPCMPTLMIISAGCRKNIAWFCVIVDFMILLSRQWTVCLP
jgi:hypothetical protein